MRLALLSLIALLTACTDKDDDSTPPEVDADGDGFTADQDCDDEDAAIFPGAAETDGDAVDQDCDGCAAALNDAGECPYAMETVVTGDEATGTFGAALGQVDADGDGFAELLVSDPTADGGAGYVELLLEGARAGAMVGASGDALGSSVLIADLDGDDDDDVIAGAPGAAGGAGAIATVDAAGLANLAGADTTVTALPCGIDPCGMGATLSFAAGLSTSGKDAVIIGAPNADVEGYGAPGAAFAQFVPMLDVSELSMDTAAAFLGDGEGDEAGAAVASGDLDADGSDDVAIGAPGADEDAGALGVVAHQLRISETVLLSDGDQATRGDEPGARLGAALAILEYNGDGYADLAIAAPAAGAGAGAVWVILGESKLSYDLSLADASFTLTPTAGGGLGASLASAGDLDEDGADELAVGAPDPGGATAGAAYLVAGGETGTAEATPSRPRPPSFRVTPFIGDELGEQFGAVVFGAGRYGGLDAFRDWMISAPMGAESLGQVVMVYDYAP